MAERSSISQTVQIGVESTPGTLVPAGKRLQAMGIEPGVNAEIEPFRPMGQKYPSISVLNREWTVAPISGVPTYTEIIYPLSSILTQTTPSLVGGSDAYEWKFSPDTFTEDNPATLTVEQGSAVRAHRFGHGLVNEFGISLSRESVELNGELFGYAIEDDITLTGTPTVIALEPVVPAEWCVYLDDSDSGLGGTKFSRVLSADLGISDRFGPLWTVDCALPSFATFVETEPTVEIKLMMEADAEGMALLDTMRAGDSKFIRIEATSPKEIEAGFPYSLTFDMAGKVTEVGEFADEEGVYAIEWTFKAHHDGTWNKALEATVVNDLTAL